jgi:2-keto-4-pentenoate hydratase
MRCRAAAGRPHNVLEHRKVVAGVLALLFAGLSSTAAAACLDGPAVAALADAFQKETPIRGLPAGLSFDDAACTRDRLVTELGRRGVGDVVGYKAGLTSAAAQKRFGHDRPVRGVFLTRMLGPAGGVPVDITGARPLLEADLLVEVRDPGIAEARTHLDVLRGLSVVMPFIELPDLAFAEGEPITGPKIVAVNVGARGGLYGKRIPVEATQAFADRLANMQVTVTDVGETGTGTKELVRAPGSAILGHPLDAVLWLLRDLAASGVSIRAGDMLSLGSFGAPLTPQPGQRLTVRYEGLPGDPAVHVVFYIRR